MINQNSKADGEHRFESKRLARAAAANAPVEEKFEKLLELQRISYELAKQAGRPSKEPWTVRIERKSVN
ncbi:hypothetical protein KF707_09565 [Candidatus Obscuribacterales bacterium]|nr:hypothetical protein [Candidatus Obscuribacterales bacterium]MBX3136472.1 hypothetical protein [Candidatus Obscuribacterales bacterium]